MQYKFKALGKPQDASLHSKSVLLFTCMF